MPQPAALPKLELLLSGRAFLEGPRWHEGKLWLSDMHRHEVLTLTSDGVCESVLHVPQRPSGLGWLPDGQLLVVSMVDRKLLRADLRGGGGENVELVTHADMYNRAPFHCNDMVVDKLGRAYVGNFGFDLDAGEKPRTTNLLLVHPEGRVEVAAEELSFPNGCVITPDGRALIVGETFASRLTVFAIGEDGALSRRRTFAQLEGAMPDGICLDAEGAVWCASPSSNEVLRVQDGGRITHRVPTDRPAIACMLGGEDGRSLFVLSAKTSAPGKARALNSARVEVTRAPVPHAGLP